MIRLFKRIKKWGYAQLAKITPGKTAVKGASIAVLITSIILFLIASLSNTSNGGDPWFFLFFVALTLVIVIFSYLLLWGLKKINSIPKKYIHALLIGIPLFLFSLAFEGIYMVAAVVITSLLGAAIAVILKGTFKKLTTPKKVITVLGMLIGIGGLTGAIIGYLPLGFDLKPTIDAASLNKDQIQNIVAPSPAEKGAYTVKNTYLW